MNRVSTPQRNGTVATVHSAAVRLGSVVGVTPMAGSLLRVERVSPNVAIMPNPPRRTAGYQFTPSISVTCALWLPHVVHAVAATANRKAGLTTNRRVSRAARASNVARSASAWARADASVMVMP